MSQNIVIEASFCPRCGIELEQLKYLQRPPLFCPKCQLPVLLLAGKYQLLRVLGEGGHGRIFLATHVRLKRNAERVVKIIHPEVANRRDLRQRFYQEVQLTAELSQRNPHIVRVFDDFGELPQLGVFYVMEYLEGQSLAELFYLSSALPSLSVILHIFEQLCFAMQSAHDAGIVHRDLKPENIMLVTQGSDPYFVKVLDFGIARALEDHGRSVLDLTDGALGTPMYMSPEQILNEPVDARSDLYAMGLILYELLTGQHPFVPRRMPIQQMTLELLFEQMAFAPPPMRFVRPDRNIPEGVEEVVMKVLAKSPAERYASAAQFWCALQRAAQGSVEKIDAAWPQPPWAAMLAQHESANTLWSFEGMSEASGSQAPQQAENQTLDRADPAQKHRQTALGFTLQVNAPAPGEKTLESTSGLQGFHQDTMLQAPITDSLAFAPTVDFVQETRIPTTKDDLDTQYDLDAQDALDTQEIREIREVQKIWEQQDVGQGQKRIRWMAAVLLLAGGLAGGLWWYLG